MKKIFIVIAHRWGNVLEHSYSVAITTKKSEAFDIARSHEDFRGDKYGCSVEEYIDTMDSVVVRKPYEHGKGTIRDCFKC